MSENSQIKIKDLFNKIFQEMYGYYYEREYIETISNFPLRTVMQYLKAYADTKKETKDDPKKTFIQKNKDIFLNSLMNFGLDLEFFDIARGEKGIDLLSLKNTKDLNIPVFIPDQVSVNKKISTIIIPQFFNRYLNFGDYYTWGIKIILPRILKEKEIEINKNDIASKKDYHIIELVIRTLMQNNIIDNFFFKIAYSDKRYSPRSTLKNEISKIIQSPDISLIFYLLPYNRILRNEKGGFHEDVFSHEYILSLFFKFINFYEENKNKLFNDQENSPLELVSNFIKDQVDNIYLLKEFEINYLSDELGGENIWIIKDEEIKKFAKIIIAWFKNMHNFEKTFNINIKDLLHLIEFSKLYNSYLNKLLQPEDSEDIGSYLGLSILLFINEIIISFLKKERKKYQSLKKDLQKFKANINKIKEHPQYYLFIDTVFLNSPILLFYLSSLGEEIKDIINMDIHDIYYYQNKLSVISIQEKTQIRTENKHLKRGIDFKKLLEYEEFKEIIDNCDPNNIEQCIELIKEKNQEKKLPLPKDETLKYHIKRLLKDKQKS